MSFVPKVLSMEVTVENDPNDSEVVGWPRLSGNVKMTIYDLRRRIPLDDRK